MREVPEAAAVDQWWGQVRTGSGPRTEEREVDVVAIDGDRTPVAVGMCKRTDSPVDFDELNLLDRLSPAMEGFPGHAHRYLFSRAGFTPRLRAHSDSDPTLHLVTPADIYT